MTDSEQNSKARQALIEAPLRYIMPVAQRSVIMDILRNSRREPGEAKAMAEKVLTLVDTYNNMPKTYEQDGAGMNAVVHLHYFRGGSDWWITERDMSMGGRRNAGKANTTKPSASALRSARMKANSVTCRCERLLRLVSNLTCTGRPRP